MSTPETEVTSPNKEKVKVNYNSRSEDRRDDRLTFDEYRTTLLNGMKGKLYIPPEWVPQDKIWKYFSINPNSERDYEMEAREKGWLPVKRSAHKYFTTRSERTKSYDSDLVIVADNLLMELDKYLWEFTLETHKELAEQRAATGGRKAQYSPRKPGLFERAESKVTKYNHERRKFSDDDY